MSAGERDGRDKGGSNEQERVRGHGRVDVVTDRRRYRRFIT